MRNAEGYADRAARTAARRFFILLERDDDRIGLPGNRSDVADAADVDSPGVDTVVTERFGPVAVVHEDDEGVRLVGQPLEKQRPDRIVAQHHPVHTDTELPTA